MRYCGELRLEERKGERATGGHVFIETRDRGSGQPMLRAFAYYVSKLAIAGEIIQVTERESMCKGLASTPCICLPVLQGQISYWHCRKKFTLFCHRESLLLHVGMRIMNYYPPRPAAFITSNRMSIGLL